ncbi:MAG TPA: hypothetical protein DC049_01790 [Spirochaetia bacterium]|nr:hypothetical protein [Spirochaetia bacterium]
MKNLVIFLTICIFLFCGCAAKKTGKKITIEFMTPVEISQLNDLTKNIKKFMKKHPDIAVVITRGDSRNYESKIQARIASGTAPDLVFLNSRFFAYFVKNNIFENLSPYIQNDNEISLDDYFPESLNFYQFDNGLYALPKGINPVVLAYNKEQFEQRGLSIPDNKWTWNVFANAARRLTVDENNDNIIDNFGCAMPPLHVLIWQSGGDILSENFTAAAVNSSHVRQAIQYQLDLINKYKCTARPAERADYGSGEEMFMTKRLSLVFMGHAKIMDFRAHKSLDWDVEIMPGFAEHPRVTFLDSAGVGILSSCKYKKEAFELLKYYCGTDGVKDRIRSGEQFPAIKKLAYSPLFLQPEKKPANHIAFCDSVSFARNYQKAMNMGRITEAFFDEVTQILEGAKNIDQGLLNAEKRINEILNNQ